MKKVLIMMMVPAMCAVFCACGSVGNNSMDDAAEDYAETMVICGEDSDDVIFCGEDAEDEGVYGTDEAECTETGENSSGDDEEYTEGNEEYMIAGEEEPVNYVDDDVDTDWYTLDEAKALAEDDATDEVSDIFVKDGDKYYALTKPSFAEVEEEYSGDKGSVRGVHYIFNEIGENQPVVLGEGMELVNVQREMPAEIISLEGRTGYTDQVIFHMIHEDEWKMVVPSQVYITGDNSEDVSELGGEELTGPTEDMMFYHDIYGESNGYNAVLDMEEGETISYGFYDGVDYIEDSITADDEYFLPDCGFDVTELGSELTKSGYATVDTDGVGNGLYCIFDSSSYGSFDAFWIVIDR